MALEEMNVGRVLDAKAKSFLKRKNFEPSITEYWPNLFCQYPNKGSLCLLKRKPNPLRKANGMNSFELPLPVIEQQASDTMAQSDLRYSMNCNASTARNVPMIATVTLTLVTLGMIVSIQ